MRLMLACTVMDGHRIRVPAETDIDFLHRIIHVRRQVRIIRGKQVFAPIKNDKTHDVRIAELLCTLLAQYTQVFPPVKVTLPWKEADGKNPEFKTFTLLLSRPDGKAMHRKMANDRWKIALRRAGIPDDRDRARKAMERFFSRPERNPASASARRDVP